MNRDSKRQVTLEDILRLKRAEKPAPEFWEQFDRELRAKQLAALVDKRPWWRSAGSLLAGMRRYHLPLGASAILALTFVAVREYRVVPAPERFDSGEVFATIETSPRAALPEEQQNLAVAAAPAVDEGTAAGAAASDGVGAAIIAAAPAATLASEQAGTRREEEVSPSARAIAANLAAAQAAVPVVTRGLLGPARGFETRALPARAAAVEPLQQMTTPAQVRSARLLSAMVAMSNDPSPRTERVASRLSGDQLYDVARRLSAKGDSFSVKF